MRVASSKPVSYAGRLSDSEDSADPHIEALLEGARVVGATLDDKGARKLLAYLDAVLEANQRINVTSIRDRGEAVVRHLVDSLSLVGVWHELAGPREPARVLDLGTGGGFPGVPLAVAWPRSAVVVADGTGKKIRLVEECLAAAGIENVEGVWSRGADLPELRPEFKRSFDVCAARAVGKTAPIVLELEPLTAQSGCILMMKGPNLAADEVRSAALVAKRRRLSVKKAQMTHVPGLDERTVLVYRREGRSGRSRGPRRQSRW